MSLYQPVFDLIHCSWCIYQELCLWFHSYYAIPYIWHKVANVASHNSCKSNSHNTFILIPWACLRVVYNRVHLVGAVGDNCKVSHKVAGGLLVQRELKEFHVGTWHICEISTTWSIPQSRSMMQGWIM